MPELSHPLNVTGVFFRKAAIVAVCSAVIVAAPASGQLDKPMTLATLPAAGDRFDAHNVPLEARVEKLLKQMTLEEKVGQLVQYSAGQPTGPGTGRSDYKEMIPRGEIGALINVREPNEILDYQKLAVEKSRLHIPILFGLDIVHGFHTEFPVQIGLASTWQPDIVEKAAHAAAQEGSAVGIRWTYSPMVDIARDARWGRMAEGAGEDPLLGSVMAAAYVRGYQGRDLAAPDTMAACAKHYVGYGAAEGGRDYNSTEISEHTLREYYLPPFHSAVNAGTATMMSAFNSLNGVPSSANHFTLTDVLRKEWGFEGFVVSDWNSVGELVPHGVAIDNRAATKEGLLAGVDMDMASSVYHDWLAKLVKSGDVPMESVDEAVRRVLRVKFALGLFDHPYVDESQAKDPFFRPESLEIAREAAENSVVLLKNDEVSGHKLLPLASAVQTVAVIGPLADNPSDPDNKSTDVKPPSSVLSLPAALAEKLGKDHVLRAKGVGVRDSDDSGINEAVETAKRADLTVLTLGEDEDMSGEATSRTRLDLPGLQEKLLEAVMATGKPVVLILFSGRPLTLPWAFERAPAVMAAWLPGVEGGPALARLLFGEATPTGRLVVSWPRAVGQEPLYYNALDTGRPPLKVDLTKPATDADSKYVSRYIDEQNSPQFPFGFGLSYTTVQYGNTSLDQSKLSAAALNKDVATKSSQPRFSAECTVKNSGDRETVETVQLYVRLEGTSTAQPVRAMKGYERIALKPGESKDVKFDLTAESLGIWDIHNKFTVEPSKATVWISSDSTTGTPATIEIGK